MVKIFTLKTSDINISDDLYKQITDKIPSTYFKNPIRQYDSNMKNHILARVVLFNAMRKYDPDISQKICYNENGKPFFENSNIHFSISHSHDFVACGISDQQIGVDVEKIKDCNIQVVKRFFHDNEYDLLSGIDDKLLQNRLFTQLWTMKESIVKAKGQALALNLKNYNFRCSNLKILPNFETKLKFDCINLGNEYILSYCGKNIFNSKCLIPINNIQNFLNVE